MKHIYLLLLCFTVSNLFAQNTKSTQAYPLMPQHQAAWNAIYENCGGENWRFKSIADLEKNSTSPYISIYKNGVAGDDGTGYQVFEVFDLSNNNLKGDVPQEFTKNENYKTKVVWRSSGFVKILLSHNEITSVPNGMGLLNYGFMHTVCVDNNKLTSFHTDDFRTFTGNGPN